MNKVFRCVVKVIVYVIKQAGSHYIDAFKTVAWMFSDAFENINNMGRLHISKSTIKSSNSNLVVSDCIVTGSNNKVTGDRNEIIGSNCKAIGNHNKLKGSNCKAIGDNNTLSGSNCKATGTGNNVSGSNSKNKETMGLTNDQLDNLKDSRNKIQERIKTVEKSFLMANCFSDPFNHVVKKEHVSKPEPTSSQLKKNSFFDGEQEVQEVSCGPEMSFPGYEGGYIFFLYYKMIEERKVDIIKEIEGYIKDYELVFDTDLYSGSEFLHDKLMEKHNNL